MATDADFDTPHLPLPTLFARFLRFGCLAFGGPVAQLAMLRQALVEEERWLSPAHFNRLLAILQVLPGPEAHEMCVHLGMMSRGRIGGLLAGLGFILPGLVLMLGVAWLYGDWIAGRTGVAGALLGVQIVVLAIIVRAVHRIGSHGLDDALLWTIAAVSFAVTLAGMPFWLPLVAGGAAYALGARRGMAIAATLVVLLAALFVLRGGTPLAGTAVPASAPTIGALFVAGLKGGLLTFGGAYTAIPYVRADTVGRDWLSDASFLDGVAAAGVLPAPLVIFATFTGYVAGGFPGALAITLGIILPAFAFSMIFYERLEAVVENAALHRLLAGVAAAVVGVIAATCVQLGMTTLARVPVLWPAMVLFALALLAVWRLKSRLATPAIIAAGAASGWLAFG